MAYVVEGGGEITCLNFFFFLFQNSITRHTVDNLRPRVICLQSSSIYSEWLRFKTKCKTVFKFELKNANVTQIFRQSR